MATLPNPLPRLASLGLALPPGRLIDETDEGPWHEPLLWLADERAIPGTWSALRRTAPSAGLLPVVLDLGGGHGGPEKWELAPDEMSYPGDHDADEVLEELWEEYTEEGDEWPGLAEPLTPTADPDERATEIADSLADGGVVTDPHIALVPARRSADIPAAIGWMGPAHHESDTARLCAVLRSWEDRFGIRLVALGFDSLLVSVAAPPATLEEAEEVAAEHFVFCPDDIGDLETYAQKLIDRPTWHFWWD
ncbi:DUF4253 domain-containing protein [Streptomyces pseudovenezuelae]|uniref:DUF4253 domain-containing protein n=1 Tax=Streptomyces pseudovenezuelae TaxID=67350 RepID=A0ABT6M252_9ACTN|nr:DUF4253 domain-containing protein [Streptomyces pseudovenezuelae]MDH6222621.1 hypothetical protein [Streptomyces pseudovenezuelae]